MDELPLLAWVNGQASALGASRLVIDFRQAALLRFFTGPRE